MSLGIKNWVSTPIPIENSGAVPLPIGECEAVHISYDIEKTDGVHHYERVNIITRHGEFIVGKGARGMSSVRQEDKSSRDLL